MEKSILEKINYIDDIYNDFNLLKIKDVLEIMFIHDFLNNIEEFKKKKKDINDMVKNIDYSQVVLNIGIFGTFSTGKSSIINSILNEKVLLDDISPSTALVSILKYGDKKKINICYRDGEEKEITEDEFQIISNHKEDTQYEYQEKREKINHIEIYYPCEVLRNINLIDTPGFSSLSEKDDNLTKDWLENVDILLWTFDINKGCIHKDELDLLNYVSSKIGSKRIIAILNKIDRKPPSERVKLMNEFKEEFNFHMLIPYSAKNVLKNVIGSRANKDFITRVVSYMVQDMEGGAEKILTISKNKVRVVINNEVVNENKLIKIKDDEYIQSYLKLKEYLLNLHNEKKNLREEELNRIIKETYFKEVNKVHYLKGKLDEQIDRFTEDIVDSLKAIDNFKKGFFYSFNSRFSMYKKKLYREMDITLRDSNNFYETNTILNHIFIQIYDDSFKDINGFIKSNDFKYITEEKIEELSFFIKQIIEACYNTIKGICEINKTQFCYINKATLDILIPDEQYKKVLEKFFVNTIDQLRKEVVADKKQKIENLQGFVGKIESILENYQSYKFQVHYEDTDGLVKKEVALDKIESIARMKAYQSDKS